MSARRLSPAFGWFAAGLGVVAAFLVFGVISRAVSPSPTGPALSSYATSSQGVAAWAALLARDDHAVRQLRTPIAAATALPADATLVILSDGSELPATDVQPLQRFVDAGGRLILGGRSARLAPALHGEVITVPHTTYLENARLADAGNAFRALALAGPVTRPVYFDEAIHGYGTATGLAALPTRWWFALLGLALALGAWALSRTARLGGSDPVSPPRPSPRAAYIEAMADTLVRAASREELTQRVRSEADRQSQFGARL